MTEIGIPDDYAWPGGETILAAESSIFWISPDPERSAVPLFLVCGSKDSGLVIIAKKCRLAWAIRVVDGLRLLTQLEIPHHDHEKL